MDQLLNRGFTLATAAALAGAGLIATTPASPIPLPGPPAQHLDAQLMDSVFATVENNINDMFYNISAAITALTQLHLSAAVDYLAGSSLSALAVPENLITAGIAALTGDTSPQIFIYPPGELTPIDPNVLGALWNDVTLIGEALLQATTSLFSLHLADAYADVTSAFNTVVVGIPVELIGGTLANLGL